MSRRAKRVDANHAKIRNYLRSFSGVTVVDTSEVGGGFGDLCVGITWAGYEFTVVVEVKDFDKPPSQRRLTEAQKRFWSTFTGDKALVMTVWDAKLLVMYYRHIATLMDSAGIPRRKHAKVASK